MAEGGGGWGAGGGGGGWMGINVIPQVSQRHV